MTRFGQVIIDTWTYGAPNTQRDLKSCHERGEAILPGRDPDDFAAPALAWNAKNELICEGIQPVVRRAYGGVDGIRQAATSRKEAREAVSAAAAANNDLSDAEMRAAMAAIPTPGAPTPAPAPAAVAKRWLAEMLAWQGHSTAEIARQLRSSDVAVRRWLKEAKG